MNAVACFTCGARADYRSTNGRGDRMYLCPARHVSVETASGPPPTPPIPDRKEPADEAVATPKPVLSQTDRVRIHMETFGSITPADAWTLYRIGRLAARIYDLRRAGVEVIETKERNGAGGKHSRYRLG